MVHQDHQSFSWRDHCYGQKKEVVILGIYVLKTVNTIFNLNHQMGIVPVPFIVSTKFKVLHKWTGGECLFVSLFLCISIAAEVSLYFLPFLTWLISFNCDADNGNPNLSSLD